MFALISFMSTDHTMTRLCLRVARGPKDRLVLVLVFFADGTYSDSDTEFLKGTGITPKVGRLTNACMK